MSFLRLLRKQNDLRRRGRSRPADPVVGGELFHCRAAGPSARTAPSGSRRPLASVADGRRCLAPSTRSKLTLLPAAIILIGVLSAGPGIAQESGGLPAALRDVGIDQKLNEKMPLDLAFRDEAGNAVTLRDYFGRKPVILTFAYYECPMLCTLVLNGLLKAMRVVPLDIGKDFEVVNISFNPKETSQLAASKKTNYVKEYGRPGAAEGWHFLVGDEEPIRKATQAAGFRYKYLPDIGQYSHASGIMVLTPDGRFSRYFYGIEYSGRDLRLGLVEASENKIGTPVDQVLLFCYHYDPVTGKYGLAITRIIQILGTATALVLATFIIVMLKREREAKAHA